MSSTGPRTVLVVDDDQDVLDLMQHILTEAGLHPEGVPTAAAAIERLKRNSISVVVADVTLPGMNGEALAAWIIEHHPSIRVIFLTADQHFRAPRHLPVFYKPQLVGDSYSFVGIVRKAMMDADTAYRIDSIQKGLDAFVEETRKGFADVSGGIESLSELISSTVRQVNNGAAVRDQEVLQLAKSVSTAKQQIAGMTLPALAKAWWAGRDFLLWSLVTVLGASLMWLGSTCRDQIIERVAVVQGVPEIKAKVERMGRDVQRILDRLDRRPQ